MKTYVLMSRLRLQGPSLIEVASRVRDGERIGRAWVDKAKELVPEANFVAHYALLGGYDFMDIYTAPDEHTAAKIAMIGSASGAFQVETWTAIPDNHLMELARQVKETEKK